MDIDKDINMKPRLLLDRPLVNDSDSDSSSELKPPEPHKENSPMKPIVERRRDRSRSRENQKHKRGQDGHSHGRNHRSGSRDRKHKRSDHHKHRESDNHKKHHKRRDSPKSDRHKTSSKNRHFSRSDNHNHNEIDKHREAEKHNSHRHRGSSSLSSPCDNNNHKDDRRRRSHRRRSPSPEKRRNYKDDLRDDYCDDAMDPATRAEKLAVDDRCGQSRVERARKAQDYQTNELMKKAEKLTGITLPKFYKPSAINPLKFAETEQKRKLLWSKKDEPSEANKSVWNVTSVIASRGDDKAAAKFKKLMGIHDSTGDHSLSDLSKKAQEQAELFRRLDADYQSARTHTHTSRGVGLGYNQSAFIDPSLYLAGRRDPN